MIGLGGLGGFRWVSLSARGKFALSHSLQNLIGGIEKGTQTHLTHPRIVP